jgi:glycosyltransferase involved in cell wall biosynthesis
MKIGLIIYGSLETISGGFLYDRRLVASLRSRGDDVRVISLPWRHYAAHLTDNLHVRLPPGLDILIQDELNHPSLLRANAGPHPYPVVSLVHNLRSAEPRPAWQNAVYRWIEARYLRSVDGFIFNSITTRAAVHSVAGGGRPNLIAYPPTDRFGPGLPPETVRARAAQPGPLRVLFLGNLIPLKGLHILLDALSLQDRDAWQLDVVGSFTRDPAYAQKVKQQAYTLGLSERVHFRGELGKEPLMQRLRQAQVLALPSSYEGFGIAYLEGMAFGLPAIATTAGAAGEIITDGVNGYLIPSHDPPALAARLRALAADRGLLERMSLKALERYHAQPAWEQTADKIRSFLIEMTMLGRPRPASAGT